MADVLLVTATKIETTVVLAVFEEGLKQKAKSLDRDQRIYWDLGSAREARVFLTQSEMGTAGLGAAIQAVQQGIETLKPSAVAMVGIAFGIDEKKQEIGDILVTVQLRPYELQRVGLHITLRGDKAHASWICFAASARRVRRWLYY